VKILFLNPPILETGELYMKEVGRCGRKAVAGELWPQTGLAYLAAVAIEEKCDVLLIDAMASGYKIDYILKAVKEFSPDMIIANATTPTFKNDAEILEILKKNHPAIYALTGTHVSALPEESLKNSPADLVFVNEAEGTLKELIKKRNNWSDIPGIAYKKENEIIITTECPYIIDLDDLPFPARNLLPNDKYRMPFFEDESYATVIPTRGCPWKCIFCRAGRVWGSKVRSRSPENVIRELEDIKNTLKIRNVVFMTDSLTLDKKWVNAFLDLLIKKNLGLRWICNSRVDAVNPEMLIKMKAAGCMLVSYGVESGSQEILDTSKKKIKLKDSENALKWTREAKITSMAYFILGLPGETHDTIKETIKFAGKINPDYVNFHIATPFPGTELYDIALKNNWLSSTDWNDFEEEGSAVLRTEDLTAEDLVKAQSRAMKSFYMRPGRIVKELLAIRSFGQFKARAKAAISLFSTLSGKKG
jgi:radical SAM superfamily enzyme YgiQ (UPF0313 family)